ncbi:gliding motility-associated C-terminal domain-containing protein [Pedobacter sp. FW305-3-2-15-E-R2A2]|uniref:T9SS type B sorting domain-containing protein n=1 Tax=Pedobacter sp. FW305-3-2-15-E-R2A2 TaxID=3140251 RepID=UPI0031406722
MNKTLLTTALCSFFLFSNKTFSQICQGSFGDPVVHIDFGRGSNVFGPPLDNNNTNYKYIPAAIPYDGFYTIEKRIQGGTPWNSINNHTPNDPDGYMMMVNASFDPGIFYETTDSTELCPNTTYEFAAWVANIGKGNGIKPNLRFMVLNMDNQVLGTYSTDDIPETPVPEWKQYGFLFSTVGNASKVKIRIINNAPGGSGNDLVLDDITFRACGPKITATIGNMGETEKTICENDNTPVVVSANVQGSPSLQYLWQRNSGGDWVDLNNETATQMTIPAQSLPPGSYQYRLVAAEPANFGSIACRTASPPVKVQVNPTPNLIISNRQSVCIGNNISMELSGTEGIYSWTGPNNFSSTERSPIIENATLAHAGLYQVTVTSGGCSAVAQVNVSVLPRPIAVVDQQSVSICKGASVTLQASGGTTYKWSPSEGLSATDIANPVASPSITTVYGLTVSNGACESTVYVIVNVFQEATADAGSNRAIIEGQSVTLNGKVSGDHIRYFWTPSNYLDDPSKLNPIANPPQDITYTLNVWSENGCPGITSDVSIKVYKKLEIPNTITPNGDGINDVWNIPALESYPEAEIKIVNRYGERIFSSGSGQKSWDGKRNGVNVPVGTYYYMINLHDGQKILTGSITILR